MDPNRMHLVVSNRVENLLEDIREITLDLEKTQEIKKEKAKRILTSGEKTKRKTQAEFTAWLSDE